MCDHQCLLCLCDVTKYNVQPSLMEGGVFLEDFKALKLHLLNSRSKGIARWNPSILSTWNIPERTHVHVYAHMCSDIIHTSHTPLHHPLLLYYYTTHVHHSCSPQVCLWPRHRLRGHLEECPSQQSWQEPALHTRPAPPYLVIKWLITRERWLIQIKIHRYILGGREREGGRDHSTFLDCFPPLRLIFPSIRY